MPSFGRDVLERQVLVRDLSDFKLDDDQSGYYYFDLNFEISNIIGRNNNFGRKREGPTGSRRDIAVRLGALGPHRLGWEK
jgi:hypothetical protein